MARLRAAPEVPLVNEQPAKPSRPPPPQLADFPIRAPDIIRFADLDRQGHVNNAVYSTYFEIGPGRDHLRP